MGRVITQNQLAVMNIHYIYYPLEHFVSTMQRIGVQHIDLWCGFPHFLIEEDNAKQVSKVRQLISSAGCDIICVTPEQCRYPVNLAFDDPEVRERTISYHMKSLEVATDLEAPLYQVVPGWGWYDSPTDHAWEIMCENLGILAKRAGELGITIILEPLQLIESNLVTSPETAKKCLSDVNSNYLKIVLDTTHMAVWGDTIEHYFEVLGNDIAHMHLNERGQVPWGEGNLPLDHYLKVMAENNYDRFFTLEICSYEHQIHADKAVEDNVSYVRNMIRKCFG